MPEAVVLETDTEPPKNLSAQAYRAWGGKGVSVVTPLFDGRWLQRVDMIEGSGPPKRKRKPRDAEVKKRLDKSQVEEMLKDEARWKLVVRESDDALYLLTRSDLQAAWDMDASGTVTLPLERLDANERASYAAAQEQFEPKSTFKRLQAGLGAPLTNVGLLALVGGGGIIGATAAADKRIEWTLPLYLAAGLAIASVLLSFLLANLVHRRTINLARLDLLEQNVSAGARPVGMTNLVIALFGLAVLCLAWALFTAPDAKTPEDVDFGTISTETTGDASTATFTVTWKGIPKEVTDVKATVGAPRQESKSATEPNANGSASHEFEDVPVTLGSDVEVTTQGLDKDGKPIGDEVKHTYPDVR